MFRKFKFLFAFILWSYAGFSGCTYIDDTVNAKDQSYFKQLEIVFRENKNWSFLPDGKNSKSVPVIVGLGLTNQNINSNDCCKGKYLFTAELPKTSFDQKYLDEPIAVFLPPVGGLKSIILNHKTIKLPLYDRLNGGIVVPLNRELEKFQLSMEFEIDSPAVRASGFGHNSQILVGYMSDMIKKREIILFHKKVVPLMIGTVAILLALVIFWIRLEIGYKTEQSFACVVMLFFSFLFCLFLSGLLRSINLYFDKFHYLTLLALKISIIRYLVVIGNFEKKTIRGITISCVLLFSVHFISIVFFPYLTIDYKIEEWVTCVSVLLVCIFLYNSHARINNEFKKIIRIFNVITALGFLSDGIKLLFEAYGIFYPLSYFNRYPFSAFLFVNVIYTIYDLSEKRTLKVKRTATEELALQIAHDVRSPLAALNAMDEEISVLPEEKRVMFRSAINRIRDIANNLLERNRLIEKNATSVDTVSITDAPIEAKSVHLISSLLDQLITEKRIQFRSKIGVEIEANLTASSYGHFALIQASEFKRVISNLINNAVESLSDSGRVTICLSGEDSNIQITIQDNGKGIPADILPKLMRRGETHGKEGGSGLGLYHAKTTLERWQGSLSLSSTVGVGTTVTITLPKAPTPDWFVPSIDLAEGSAVVVLDDDSSIHQIWQSRIDAVTSGASVRIIHCSTSLEVEQLVTHSSGLYKTVLYLFDYELLSDQENGLDLIETLHLEKSAILVTSRYEEAIVREKCEKLGVRLIPKGMAGFVPISIQAPKKNSIMTSSYT